MKGRLMYFEGRVPSLNKCNPNAAQWGGLQMRNTVSFEMAVLDYNFFLGWLILPVSNYTEIYNSNDAEWFGSYSY